MLVNSTEEKQAFFANIDYPISNEEKIIARKLLARFDGFSDWTKEHSERVGQMAEAFALYLGASDMGANNFGLAAMLHDVGKLNIPKEILNTKTPLNKKDFERFLKPHAQDSEQILKKEFAKFDSPFVKTAIEISLGHHEKFSGAGYPKGRAGENIAFSARVVALCDVFDAMNYVRPYQTALSQGEILSRMIDPQNNKLKGSFEPSLLKAFVAFRLVEYEKMKNNPNADKHYHITSSQLAKLKKFCQKDTNVILNTIIKHQVSQR